MKILFVLPYVPSVIRVRPYHFIRQLARRHQELVMQKVRIAQEPTDMDFGRTFVALDADGNRLRFYASNRR